MSETSTYKHKFTLLVEESENKNSNIFRGLCKRLCEESSLAVECNLLHSSLAYQRDQGDLE